MLLNPPKLGMFEGLEIGGYRSIGAVQRIAPLGKINLFVGQNNSGKSNVLRFVSRYSQQAVRSFGPERKPLRIPQSEAHFSTPVEKRVGFGMLLSIDRLKRELLKPPILHNYNVERFQAAIAPNNWFWVDGGEKRSWPVKEAVIEIANKVDHHWLHAAWRQFHAQNHGGDPIELWIPGLLTGLVERLLPGPFRPVEIPITRAATAKAPAAAPGTEKVDESAPIIMSGTGVINALAAMENPGFERYDEQRAKFEKIREFVCQVVDSPEAKLTVPSTQDMILVSVHGQRYLPLADLGSGVEQVVLHAIAATATSDTVVTIEEPELHLHPVLQRQLVAYLQSTSNQYFIATHSAHMIDMPGVNVFQVRLEDRATVIESAATHDSRWRICRELGYRASDIVQSNCVIWVEGPSDRVYLRHWLKQVDDHLEEHVHYSIMFYGGKLLSHLSAGRTDPAEEDEQLENLIRLRLLNRHVAVVIDSDRKKAGEKVRDTKARVEKEIGEAGGFVWITAGREIENYVPAAVLKPALNAVQAGKGDALRYGQFLNLLTVKKGEKKTSLNKVKVAEAVVAKGCPLTHYDLDEKVRALATFIRESNGLKPLA